MRPRAILLTGAPGTGKSTLGRMLATLLRVPFIARDDIRGALALSRGAWTGELAALPSTDETVEIFLRAVEGLLGSGASCVVEYVVRSHRPDDLDRLTTAGDCVAIFTSCDDPMSRLVERNRNDRLIANAAVLRATGATTVGEHTAALIDRMGLVEQEMMRILPVPTLHVDTTWGLDPDIEAVLAFATSQH